MNKKYINITDLGAIVGEITMVSCCLFFLIKILIPENDLVEIIFGSILFTGLITLLTLMIIDTINDW